MVLINDVVNWRSPATNAVVVRSGMTTNSAEELQALSAQLKSLSKDQLVALLLAQQDQATDLHTLAEDIASSSASYGDRVDSSPNPPMLAAQMFSNSPSSSKPRRSWIPGLFLMVSLAFHGLLLALPVPTPTAEEGAELDVDTLISLSEMELPPTQTVPPIPESSPPAPEPEVEADPPIVESLPEPQRVSPVPTPSAPPPVADPEPTVEPPAQPESEERIIDPEEPEEPEVEKPLGPTEISGVPVSPDWQLIEQFQEVQQGGQVAEVEWYAGESGTFREEILGMLRISDEEFEGFWERYQNELRNKGFTIRPEGRVAGAILYQLNQTESSRRLYLSIETLEDEEEILLGIWNQYPW
jgi:outer membrane biosynthesis protein TonB